VATSVDYSITWAGQSILAVHANVKLATISVSRRPLQQVRKAVAA